MSVGSLVGAVGGGIIGFFIGGPVGAFYGACLGFALGMVVDPMTPDMPSVGAPDQSELTMSGEVGDPIADLTGTAKITGHLLCYGKERSEPIYSRSSGGGGGKGGGGGGGSSKQITGHKYYMSWAVGIIAGKTDVLYTIFRNDEIVWEGELNCPASGGEETITLERMGSATFYFGTNDHALNSKVGVLLDDSGLNTPYRHLCWCFFDDCCIGEYNRAPAMRFIVKKTPSYSFSSANTIQKLDCNPAHSTWYVLHDLLGLPESWLNSDDFKAYSDTLTVECRGVSILFDRQQNALSYLESINAHVDSILRYGIDGKFHPKLIRDDYTVGDLPTINEDVILEEPSFDRRSWIDTLNEMKVQYSEIISVIRLNPKGYSMGGSNSTRIEDLIFSNETSQAIAATLSTRQCCAAGVSSSTKGYILGGLYYNSNRIEFLIFSSEATQVLWNTLSVGKHGGTGVSSSSKGYIMGGNTGHAINVIENLHFTHETNQVLSATLNAAKYFGTGVSSSSKGYIMGGWPNTAVIEDLIFSSETSQAITATLDIAKREGTGVSGTYKGYIMGGWRPHPFNAVAAIEDLIFSSETSQAITATLNVARRAGAGVSGWAKGYIMGGYTGTSVNIIEDLHFTSEASQTISAQLDTATDNAIGVQCEY